MRVIPYQTAPEEFRKKVDAADSYAEVPKDYLDEHGDVRVRDYLS